MPISAKRIRDHCVLNISYQTAAAAGWSYSELTQFVAGSYHPGENQLLALAAVLKMKLEDIYR